MRDASQNHNNRKDMSIMDVTSDAIHQFFMQHKIDILIHGHTHRPATHQVDGSKLSGTRIVLGDWHDTGWCLILDGQERKLEEFQL